jgi:hypothetical protein
MKIFLGLLGIGIGIIVTLKYEWLLYNVGRLPSIEKYLGSFGGSRLFYQLLGVLIIFFSTLYMTGLLNRLIEAIFFRVFGIEA